MLWKINLNKQVNIIMKLKNIKLIFLLLLSLQFKLFSQVNLQTGSAQVNIPIFSYSDRYGLNCGVMLNYIDGNGLKVNEIASSVGTGWNLNCGGSIDRVQNGEPDDQQRPSNNSWSYSNSFTNSDLYYPNGYLYSSYATSDDVDSKAAFIPFVQSPALHYLPHPKYTEDREQDYFNFSFNGRSGTFVIGRNGVIKILGDSKLLVTKQDLDMHSSNIRTTINSFTITDENGILYLFNEKILMEVCKYENTSYPDANGMVAKDEGSTVQMASFFCKSYLSCNSNSTYDYKVFQARRLHEFTVSSWYLSEIINPRTNKRINFNYESYDIDFRAEGLLQSSMGAGHDAMALTIKRYLYTAKRLVDIITPDKISMHLTYSSQTRKDFLNDKALVNIDYRINGILKYSYDFKYGYFFKNEIKDFNYTFLDNDRIYTRLCLQSVQKKGFDGKTEPPYKLNYNIQREPPYDNYLYTLPAMFTLQQDKWGYYKDRTGAMPDFVFDPNLNSFQVPSAYSLSQLSKYPESFRIVSGGIAKYGIIKSIEYPQGGILSFEYEQRDAFNNNQNAFIGGVRVNKTVLYDGIDHAKDAVLQYNFHDPSNNSTGWGYEEPVFSRVSTTRQYKSDYNYAALFSHGVSIAVTYGQFTNTPMWSVASPAASLASLNQSIATFIVDFILAIIDAFSPDYRDYTITQYSYTPYNSNCLIQQYSKVEITQNLIAGNNGKTIYEFTSVNNLPLLVNNLALPVPVLNSPFSNKQRVAYWVYGLPKKVTVQKFANNSFQNVKQTEYDYNFIVNTLSDANYLSKKWEVIMPTYVPRILYDNLIGTQGPGTATDNILSDSYSPITGRTELISVKDRVYNTQGSYIETLKEFGYNTANYQVNYTKTIDSKSDLTENKIYYPYDYSNTGIFATMINENMINQPIASETWITKGNGQPQLINATGTDFSVIGNGDIQPIKKYSLESAIPVPQNALQLFNPNSAVRDANYIKEQQQYVYDNLKGSLAGTISRGKMSSVLYDYNDALISMNIQNANAGPGYFAYTSFEAQNKGGWHYNDEGILHQYAPTGKYCYQLSSNNNISALIFFSKPYILSFWASNSNVQVNGNFNPVKTVNGIAGWTYYEFELPAGTSTSNISGSALVDEVRLYAKDAHMVTYTYDEFNNKTSECDANNHILYYEYDGLGRPLIIRDGKGNILKTYEYHYKNN